MAMSGLGSIEVQLMGWLALLLVGMPFSAVLVPAAADRIRTKKENRENLSPAGQIREFVGGWREKTQAENRSRIFWVLFQLAFSLLALLFFGLKLNLAVILFFVGFAWICRIMTQQESPVGHGTNATDSPVRNFLLYLPILLLVGAGIGLLTGTLSLSSISAQPRWLVLELPFLWLALVAVIFRLQGGSSRSGFSGRLQITERLAGCYWLGTLLLLAGAFWSRNLAGMVLAAVIIYFILCLVRRFRERLYWPAMTAWSDGTLYFACLINYCWIYIKYWLF